MPLSASNLVNLPPPKRIVTGFREIDDLFGDYINNGIVLGSNCLVSGPRGTGKTTILMQIAGYAARHGFRSVFMSCEQSTADLLLMGSRLGIKSPLIEIYGDACNLSETIDDFLPRKPALFFVDSLNNMCLDSTNMNFNWQQMNKCYTYLTTMAKVKQIAIFTVAHNNKQGITTVPSLALHLVDVMLNIEPIDVNATGSMKHDHIFELTKNRYGFCKTKTLEMTYKGFTIPFKRSLQLRVHPNDL